MTHAQDFEHARILETSIAVAIAHRDKLLTQADYYTRVAASLRNRAADMNKRIGESKRMLASTRGKLL